MAKVIANDIRACDDCLCYIANGTTEDEAMDKRIARKIPELLDYYCAPKGHLVVSDDTEGFFSWCDCDVCHGDTGGTRHLVAIIE